jgi:hypothetical protein
MTLRRMARLFAFAEGRDVPGCDDHGEPGAVVLLMKTSDDRGRTWQGLRQVALRRVLSPPDAPDLSFIEGRAKALAAL